MFTRVCASSCSLLTPTGSLDPPPQLDPKNPKALCRGTLTRPRTQENPAVTGAAIPPKKVKKKRSQYREKLLKVFIYLHFLQLTCCLEEASSV